MKNVLFILIILLMGCTAGKKLKYKDPSLPVEDRVNDLINRMTLEQKAAQLKGFWSMDTTSFDIDDNFNPGKDSARLSNGTGSFFSRAFFTGGTRNRNIKRVNNFQKYLVEKTSLGIPALMFSEGLHGAMIPGATSFPQAIALGSTWDTTLVEQIFTAAALEAHAAGSWQVLSPVLDLARDPRWGRTEECYSEDPWLTSRLGMAAVHGFQGRGILIPEGHVSVTLKHFAGHGQPEGGRNLAPVNYSDRYFRETHLYPFEMAVKQAHAQSLMASYNEWDGVPNHVNRKLLTDILRGEWGFDGYVMSDGGGMDVTYRNHLAAADSAESGILSIMAGLDYDLGSNGCFAALPEQVRLGKLDETFITEAAKNVLRVKFRLGMFDHPYIDENQFDQVTTSREHKDLALKAAHESMILMKNDNNMLPFDSSAIRTLAVIGPDAAEIHLGGYSAIPMRGESVLDGIKKFAEGKFRVLYAEGCKITTNKECNWLVNEKPLLNNPASDRKLIAEAVGIARRSDAVILVIGENELVNREAWNEHHLGDTDDLGLIGMQEELAEAILATGKPSVVLLINGRPLSINKIKEKAPAIIEGWYLGERTGTAVADVIFGKVNPSGKLTITFPKSAGQLPDFYDKKPTNHRNYEFLEPGPMFPFGFGLSYTSFKYENLKVSPEEIKSGEEAWAEVEITNTGKVAGDEIVQLYIHDVVSLPTRPVKELKGFSRISLLPGEKKTLKFKIAREHLEAYDLDMKRTIQPGDFEIMIGTNSEDVLKGILHVLK